MTLAPGPYTGEWFAVDRRKTAAAGEVTGDGLTAFTPPFAPAVLHLR